MNIARTSLSVSLLLAAPAFAQDCRFRNLGNLGMDFTAVSAISDDGTTLVGYSRTAQNRNHAFRWTLSGGMEDLDVPTGDSDATAVSADGSVVVGAVAVGGVTRGFRWTRETGMELLGSLGGNFTAPLVVSDDGSVIAGESRNAALQMRYFRWTRETGVQDLGLVPSNYPTVMRDIDASGEFIVGTRQDALQSIAAFRFDQEEGLRYLGTLGGTVSNAYDISADASTIVGDSSTGNGGGAAFVWRANTGMTALPHPAPNVSSIAYGITSDGRWVAGNSITSRNVWSLTRWDLATNTVLDLGRQSGPTTIRPDVVGVGDEGRAIAVSMITSGVYRAYRWSISADLNNDAFVDAFDVIEYFDQFEAGGSRADFNHDGFIDFFDVIAFYEAFESGC